MFKGLSLLAVSEAAGSVRRQVKALPWFAAGAVIGLFAVAALLEAAHAWLSLRMGPVMAHLVVGGSLLAGGALLAAIGLYVRSQKQPRDGLTTTALVAAPMAANLVRRHAAMPVLAVAGVIAAGAALGRALGKSA
jgi:hypothetical protein